LAHSKGRKRIYRDRRNLSSCQSVLGAEKTFVSKKNSGSDERRGGEKRLGKAKLTNGKRRGAKRESVCVRVRKERERERR